MSTRIRGISIVMAVTLLVPTLLFSAGQDETVEFFQNKPEAVDTFDELIDRFMDENPEIELEQNQQPEANTVLMTRLASNEFPPVISINADATYGELAESGVLATWDDSEVVSRVQDSYIEMTQLLAEDMDNIYGIPLSTNANGLLYNKDVFDEHGVDVPETWTELIEAAEKFESEGQQAFFHAFGDAWTTMPAWNALAGNIQPDDFPEKLRNGETTFSEHYREPAEKLLELLEYGGDDDFGYTYPDGNQALANGDAAMLIQGNWAIGEVLDANPDARIGITALPVHDSADENELISGVDSILALSAEATEFEREVGRDFIDFLTRDDNLEYYIQQQSLFSATDGVFQDDDILQGVQEFFEEDRLTYFPDHYYPPEMAFDEMVIGFLQDGDVDQFLEDLDDEYETVTNR